ncbi:MAG: S8 family serine peptidase, partial [Candidatus Spyradosoma sp.]
MKIRLPLSLLLACACVPAVSYAATTVSPTAVFSDPYINKQWQWYPSKNGVNIAPLWEEGITGAGVVIGIIDEWVEPNHEDLNVSPYNPGDDPYDGNGLSKDFIGTEAIPDDGSQIYTSDDHGTFVAGMAGAVGGNDKGLVGAAPGAILAGLHVAVNNSFNGSATLNAMYWGSGVSSSASGITYDRDAAIQVKNCSFGSFYAQAGVSSILDAVHAGTKNNVIYVFSAGNERALFGYGYVASTGWSTYGNSKDVINVAATNSSGTYADFSCFGSNVFVTAPGKGVASTDRTGELGYNKGELSSSLISESSTTASISNPDYYGEGEGTSFSAPLVSGVIALGKQICSVMDARWAKHALAYSSGYGDAPNIDCVKNADGQWVQKSGYTETTIDSTTGESVTSTVVATGEWQQNKGGYWFNNNYGFGMVNPVGFVEKVRDIAYTTVETTYSSALSSITKIDSSESAGTIRSAEYSVGVNRSDTEGNPVSALNQPVETVSVTVTFSEAAIAAAGFDINSLKVTLEDSFGVKSVLVQQSAGDPAVSVGSVAGEGATAFSYTFLSNAFWGTSYSSADWKLKIEYEGVTENGLAVDMTDWVTVSSVDFTMGQSVDEGNIVISGRTENAHALALDSGLFVVASGGKFFVEDAVLVTSGSFIVNSGGEVGFYEDAELQGKDALFLQYGGYAAIYGSATFDRGICVNGGEFVLGSATVSATAGTVINGGVFRVLRDSGNLTYSAGAVTLNGGSLVLEQSADFGSSVTVNGGSFVANESSKGTQLVVLGGSAALKNKTTFSSVSVGQAASEGEGEQAGVPARGGSLVVTGKVTSSGGVSFDGVATGTLEKDAQLVSAVSVSGNAVFSLVSNTQIQGALTLTGNARTSWTGTTDISSVQVSGGALVAQGITTLKSSGGVTIGNGGSFKSGKTTVEGNFAVEAGATLMFASRSRDDFDTLTVNGTFSFSAWDSLTDATTSILYDFGNAVPYAAKLISVNGTATVSDIGHISLRNAAWPKYWTRSGSGFVAADLAFSLNYDDVAQSISLAPEQDFDNLHLYYASTQTPMQTAVQKALLRNQQNGALGAFLDEFNSLNLVTELMSAYDDLGTPVNLVAIDELHDKQASAVTSALSRRSRELRSGFIHSDTWSNPLFGNSGFSFSARPNLVAAKGFVPYMIPEDDYPTMVWLNGAYSFSEADDAGTALTSTKSNMLSVFMGVDYAVSREFALGLFAGYTSGRTKFDDGGRTEIQSRNLGVYLTGAKTSSIGSLYYTALAAFGFEEYDFSRKISVGALNSTATASPDGWQGIVSLEGGYEWKLD